jgi:hypothetical protein
MKIKKMIKLSRNQPASAEVASERATRSTISLASQLKAVLSLAAKALAKNNGDARRSRNIISLLCYKHQAK